MKFSVYQQISTNPGSVGILDRNGYNFTILTPSDSSKNTFPM